MVIQRQTKNNGYPFRYWLPANLYMHVALCGGLVTGFWPILRARAKKIVSLSCFVWPLAAAWLTYGQPSLSQVRADLDQHMGAHTPKLLESRCTHLLGRYWDVWPAVFHANLTLYEQGKQEMIWGITHRSSVTQDTWQSLPVSTWRLAVLTQKQAQQQDALRYLHGYRIPKPSHVEDHEIFQVWSYD